MALVTDYATLQTEILALLNRSGSEMEAAAPGWIQLFEAYANRGIRMPDGSVIPIRKHINYGDYTISVDGQLLPSDLYSVESFYLDGPTYYGPLINVATAQELSTLKKTYGDSGVPQFYAIVNGRIRFAPEPDGAYTAKLTYWAKVTALSATNTTNWLLTDHPDIYLYGAALETAPYLKHDVRIPVWKDLLVDRVESLHQANQNVLTSGAVRRRIRPIGG